MDQRVPHPSPLEHALLGLLAAGARYGYELRGRLEDEFGSTWRVDFGQLYRALAALRRKHWATARVEPSPRGPRRKVYVITRRGRSALDRWLRDPTAAERTRDELPLKLRFGSPSRRSALAPLIRERRRLLNSRRHEEQHRCEQMRAAGDTTR